MKFGKILLSSKLIQKPYEFCDDGIIQKEVSFQTKFLSLGV